MAQKLCLIDTTQRGKDNVLKLYKLGIKICAINASIFPLHLPQTVSWIRNLGSLLTSNHNSCPYRRNDLTVKENLHPLAIRTKGIAVCALIVWMWNALWQNSCAATGFSAATFLL